MHSGSFCARSSLLAALAVTTTPLAAQETVLERGLAEIAREHLDGSGTRALAIAVEAGGELLVAKGFGEVDGEAFQPASAFEAAALLEPLIAMHLLDLADHGRLDLARPLAELLGEDLGGQRLPGDPILWHGLTQTSGLPPMADLLAATRDAAAGEEEAPLAPFADAALVASPGSCRVHTWANVALAARVLEALEEQPIEEFLGKLIVDDLALDATTFGPVELPSKVYVEVQSELVEGLLPEVLGQVADFHTSALDLVRIHRALLDRELVTEATFRRLTQPVMLSDGRDSHFVGGFNLSSLDQHRRMSLGGGSDEDRHHVAVYPDMDTVIVVAGVGAGDALDRLERQIARLVFDLPEPGLLDLQLSIALAQPYLGEYYLGCNAWGVRYAGERLVVDPPNGPRRVLLSQGDHVFIDRDDIDVSLTFELEEDRAVAFLLDEHGSESKAVRL